MTLQTDQIASIRETWALAAQNGPMLARLFYGRLFRIAPQTRALFAEDTGPQERKLTATLAFIVDNLDRPEVLRPAAHALAARHVGYGVTAAQYAPVGEALTWALANLLGPRFDAEARAAWSAVYDALSADMVAVAYGEGAAASRAQRGTYTEG
ncbi:MAG: globin domain-containing protein [Pseudomonadota bacterium]